MNWGAFQISIVRVAGETRSMHANLPAIPSNRPGPVSNWIPTEDRADERKKDSTVPKILSAPLLFSLSLSLCFYSDPRFPRSAFPPIFPRSLSSLFVRNDKGEEEGVSAREIKVRA